MTNATIAAQNVGLNPELHNDLAQAVLSHLYLELKIDVGCSPLPLGDDLNLGAVVLTNGDKQIPLDIDNFYIGAPLNGYCTVTCYFEDNFDELVNLYKDSPEFSNINREGLYEILSSDLAALQGSINLVNQTTSQTREASKSVIEKISKMTIKSLASSDFAVPVKHDESL